MDKRKITEELLQMFIGHLQEDEKSEATIKKYTHDIRCFAEYAEGKEINKALTLAYKALLDEKYATVSANSMLAALNMFLQFMEWHDCCVKRFKIQKQTYCPEEKELTKAEYQRLIYTAGKQGNERLALLIQTICGTGIRVSELQYITVEALKKGEAVVSCKAKTRTVFIISALCRKLLSYAKRKQIKSGSVFVTRTGKPVNRSNIWREMKELCSQAAVAPEKVFPHNLRHLFARTFYCIEKDIAKLADILGHTNVNTTRIYIVTTGAEHRRKLESMRLVT